MQSTSVTYFYTYAPIINIPSFSFQFSNGYITKTNYPTKSPSLINKYNTTNSQNNNTIVMSPPIPNLNLERINNNLLVANLVMTTISTFILLFISFYKFHYKKKHKKKYLTNNYSFGTQYNSDF